MIDSKLLKPLGSQFADGRHAGCRQLFLGLGLDRLNPFLAELIRRQAHLFPQE